MSFASLYIIDPLFGDSEELNGLELMAVRAPLGKREVESDGVYIKNPL